MKLWHKHAIALFLAAVLPLTIVAWLIASRGESELADASRQYLVRTSDAALGEVRARIERGVSEARTIGATLALPGVSADDRMGLARAQLVGAEVLDGYVVYTPEGLTVQYLQAANAEATAASAASVPAPEPLPEALRGAADAKDAAFSPITRGADGGLYLPMTVRIRKPSGELYAFGWTAIPLAPFSHIVSDTADRSFRDRDRVTLVDAGGAGEGLASLRVVAAEDPKRLFTALDVAQSDLQASRPLAHDVSQSFDFYTASGEQRFMALTPIVEPRFAGLSLGVATEQPAVEVFAPVDRIRSTALMVGLVSALIALLIGVWAGRRLSAPVVAVSNAAGVVARGDFSVQVPVPGKDEVGHLARSFNAMTRQLTSTIDQLQAATAARERLQTELDIARKIQMSMVPLHFPAFPERKDIDVFAALKPAFEVGGDFYDFFLIDDHTLCVCIADVSGKGVPAALFMAVTRTLVKAHASAGASSDEILARINDDLAKDNDACMFVTVFLGLLHLGTGVLSYTNAGHNPAYLKKASGETRRLDQLHGPVVAAMEDVPYGSGEVKLDAGDTLFLYTDGVNEAMNASHHLFTEERLAGLLRDGTWRSSSAAVELVLDDVWRFQGSAEQADDVTVLAVRYLGS